MPDPTNDTWRAWLTSGVRRRPADRRRLRGANRGLKQMLLEGMDRSHAWTDFSGAMVRQAVDDAMRALPDQDKQVVKLAYFGGYSNREIAERTGLTETTVQRRLRRALAEIGEYVQHGRELGRRVAYAVMLWLSGRWLSDHAHHVLVAASAAAVTVIVVAQPAAPVAHVPAPAAQPPAAHAPAPVAAPAAPAPAPPAPAATQQPSVSLPVVAPPLPMQLPPLPVDVKTPKLQNPG